MAHPPSYAVRSIHSISPDLSTMSPLTRSSSLPRVAIPTRLIPLDSEPATTPSASHGLSLTSSLLTSTSAASPPPPPLTSTQIIPPIAATVSSNPTAASIGRSTRTESNPFKLDAAELSALQQFPSGGGGGAPLSHPHPIRSSSLVLRPGDMEGLFDMPTTPSPPAGAGTTTAGPGGGKDGTPSGGPSLRFRAVVVDLADVLQILPVLAHAMRVAGETFLEKYFRVNFDEHTEEDSKKTFPFIESLQSTPAFEVLRAFLSFHGITLPVGQRDDKADQWTLSGLFTACSLAFSDLIEHEPIPCDRALAHILQNLKASGCLIGAIWSAQKGRLMLQNAGILRLFDAVVDKEIQDAFGLRHRPAPDVLLKLCSNMAVSPYETVALFSLRSGGIPAAKNGTFGLVIGICSAQHPATDEEQKKTMLKAGADVVIHSPKDVDSVVINKWYVSGIQEDAWRLVYTTYSPEAEQHRESLTSIGNGYIGTRGCWEGERYSANHYPGTYVAGVFNTVRCNATECAMLGSLDNPLTPTSAITGCGLTCRTHLPPPPSSEAHQSPSFNDGPDKSGLDILAPVLPSHPSQPASSIPSIGSMLSTSSSLPRGDDCDSSPLSCGSNSTVAHAVLVNCPNWCLIQFRVGNGEWISPDQAEIISYQHSVSFRDGVVERSVTFRDKYHQETRIDCKRLASMKAFHRLATVYSIKPLNYSGPVTIRSSIDAMHLGGPLVGNGCHSPHHLTVLKRAPVPGKGIIMITQTTESKVAMAVYAQHKMTMGSTWMEACDEQVITGDLTISEQFTFMAAKGTEYTLHKIVSVYSSRDEEFRRYDPTFCTDKSEPGSGGALSTAPSSRSSPIPTTPLNFHNLPVPSSGGGPAGAVSAPSSCLSPSFSSSPASYSVATTSLTPTFIPANTTFSSLLSGSRPPTNHQKPVPATPASDTTTPNTNNGGTASDPVAAAARPPGTTTTTSNSSFAHSSFSSYPATSAPPFDPTDEKAVLNELEQRAIQELHHVTQWEQLYDAHRTVWAELWEKADLRVDGDRLAQKMARLHTYHLLIAASPHQMHIDAGITVQGLAGEGCGHVMWDEVFVFPFFLSKFPKVCKAHLLYRYRRLPQAKRNAEQLGFKGALFPWHSADTGEEVSRLRMSASRMQPYVRSQRYHVNLAVFLDCWRFYQRTLDIAFLHDVLAEMMLEIALFWVSIAVFNESDGRFHISGVVGPDSFHQRTRGGQFGCTDNAYTNVMVVWMLGIVKELLTILQPEAVNGLSAKVGLTAEILARMSEMRTKMAVHFTQDGVIQQFDGFADLKDLDWESYRAKYSFEFMSHIGDILRREGRSTEDYTVIKQPDTLMLFYFLSPTEVYDILTQLGYEIVENELEFLRKNYDYYVKRTSHAMPLSCTIMSKIAHLCGKADYAWDWFLEAAKTDLFNREGKTHAGVHCATMAGTLDIVSSIFIGFKLARDNVIIQPALPRHWQKIKIRKLVRGSWYAITVTKKQVKISLESTSGKVHTDKLDATLGTPIVVGGNRLMICPWSKVSVKYNKVTTMKHFYELMAKTKFVRKSIVHTYFNPHAGSCSIDNEIEVLKHALQNLQSVPTTDSGMAQLALDPKKRMNLDLTYEITELSKDICFFEQGGPQLTMQFMIPKCPNFETLVNEGIEFLGGGEDTWFRNFITDRDGTINNYCGRYRSSIQSAYNSIYITRFVMECTNQAIILTAAPLQAIIDISVNPDNTFIYAASMGREFLNVDMVYHMADMDAGQKLLMKRFNARIKTLMQQPHYEKLTMIGSGLQFKFGQTTISRQDVSQSISAAESLDFLETVRHLAHEIAPHGELHVHDTGLDIEISPTVKPDKSNKPADDTTFHKGKGLQFLNERLNLHVQDGPNLVCGDTSSDLAMVDAAMALCPDSTFCIFVTKDPQLAARAHAICPRTLIVPCPDVLITILNEAALRHHLKRGASPQSTLDLNDLRLF